MHYILFFSTRIGYLDPGNLPLYYFSSWAMKPSNSNTLHTIGGRGRPLENVQSKTWI